MTRLRSHTNNTLVLTQILLTNRAKVSLPRCSVVCGRGREGGVEGVSVEGFEGVSGRGESGGGVEGVSGGGVEGGSGGGVEGVSVGGVVGVSE